ncbi:MAG: NUDIX domain-containing protein [Terracidiphilus sp.]|jgi:predicted NUDIX family NTP pyrophosphohydrolase
MAKLSAGILLYRIRGGRHEVFLVHPGGPFWRKKDLGAWSIPKGEYLPEENPLDAAKREFREETSFAPPEGDYVALGELRQPSGKVVTAWAVEGDCPDDQVKSNLFSMEWPPKSGRMQQFPEVDRAAWFPLAIAREKILRGQAAFLDRLAERLGQAT